MNRPLLLVAASGLASEIIEAVRACDGRQLRGVLDDDPARHGGLVAGVPVLGAVERVQAHSDCDVVVCTGKGSVRSVLVSRLADVGVTASRYATIVHPAAHVASSCTVGVGSIVMAGAVLTADVRLGDHVVVMPGCILTHGDEVESFATLGAAVVLGGQVVVGARSYVGMGAGVRERVSIGRDVMVGMGAVVLEDVPDGQVWAGVPATRLEHDISGRAERTRR